MKTKAKPQDAPTLLSLAAGLERRLKDLEFTAQAAQITANCNEDTICDIWDLLAGELGVDNQDIDTTMHAVAQALKRADAFEQRLQALERGFQAMQSEVRELRQGALA